MKQGRPGSFSTFYASARLKSECLQTFQYGRIEARIKLPYGQGIWPAFWMLGSNIDKVGWPLAGEIDLMEHINDQPWIQGTAHGPAASGCVADTAVDCGYGAPPECNASNVGQKVPGDFSQNYHLFAVQWDSDQTIKFFVDDPDYQRPYFTVSPNSNYPYPWVFDDPFFILLNVAVGGNFPGNPDASTFAGGQAREMLVDYVRVYQPTNAPTPTPVAASTGTAIRQ